VIPITSPFKEAERTRTDVVRQLEQTLVLIKSILITTKFRKSEQKKNSCIQFIILSDTKEYFNQIHKRIYLTEKWDPSFTEYLKLTYAQGKFSRGK